LGDLLWKNDPFRVKHSRTVWGKVDPPTFAPGSAHYFEQSFDSSKWQSPDFPYYVLDTEPEFMNLDDQREEAEIGSPIWAYSSSCFAPRFGKGK
jgi:hypothetical protein